MYHFSASPKEMAVSFWRNRSLIFALVKREVMGRYRGSAMGILWSFFNPVLMLTVYTFVFSVVFKARWTAVSDSKTEFALVLFSGLLVFNLFSECISRAPGLILSNANYVKKVVFPLEILPWVAMGTAVFHTAISFGVWLIFYIGLVGIPQMTVAFFPLVLLSLILGTMGISWFLASLGVYVRDIGQVIGFAVTALLFLSPIFYPVAALPDEYRGFIYLNPLTQIVEQARDVLMWGNMPDLIMVMRSTLLGALVAWLGFFWFQKTRRGFADVI